ncbi:hypothetical protein LC613_04550 [Nostoc sphaeroides CHAB 2801]|uniref:hypothetical protein n=1 Tax=Nostoc sphaeroides TaxID=446679 RepID=UPI000E4C6254|nr:hypothetical protein [Nostoc sphaeroides]MCC5627464.1 hypothetical protein [Nostoc sphaeroides CHAB 2801]
MHPPFSNNPKKPQDLFLVCGLQSLGQHSVAVLKEYDVKVSAIDDVQPEHWEVPEVPSLPLVLSSLDLSMFPDLCQHFLFL